MEDKPSDLVSVGARLREERERLGLNQEALGRVGEVTRQTQSEYEAGRRPWTVAYMLAVQPAGIDPVYLLTGTRDVERIDASDLALLDACSRLGPVERTAIDTVVRGLAGRNSPISVHASASRYGAPPSKLPSEAALARGLEGVLAVYPDLAGDALARALAKHLPSVLEAARDHKPDQAEPAPAPAASPATDRREAATGRRT